MARILFGVIGDAGGHISQALAVADSMPQHEFLFVGGGRVPRLTRLGYSVAEISSFETYYRKNRVDLFTTARKGLGTILDTNRNVAKVMDIMREFKPDLVFTAYEYAVPIAAHRLGIPVISVDNHHFLTKCKCVLPRGQAASRLAYSFPLRLFFSNADFFFISAFYSLEPRNPRDTAVFPSVLRKAVLDVTPRDGDHVLVYHTSPTFRGLSRVLEQIPRKFHIYGLGERPSRKNLVYKAPSIKGFLQDVASCQYVVTNGGHNLMAEALYYGKPVLSFPIDFAYEQFFNGHMLRLLGYGDYCLSPSPPLSVLQSFEQRLDRFRANIAGGEFCGNEKLVAKAETFL
jgi:uncharacterized protein (TIGR00661 family)